MGALGGSWRAELGCRKAVGQSLWSQGNKSPMRTGEADNQRGFLPLGRKRSQGAPLLQWLFKQ